MEKRLEGINPRQAAIESGYLGRKVRTPVKLIETPELKARMQRALRGQDVGLNRIAATVSKSLEANVVSKTKHGCEETDIPDHGIRLKAADAAARLWGLTETARDYGGGSAITLTLAGPLAERLAAKLAGG